MQSRNVYGQSTSDMISLGVSLTTESGYSLISMDEEHNALIRKIGQSNCRIYLDESRFNTQMLSCVSTLHINPLK